MALAGIGILLPAGAAWACLGLAGITTSAASVQPGGTVTVNGVEFYGAKTVQLRLDSLNGPVLATATPDANSHSFSQAVTMPASLPTGRHVLVATVVPGKSGTLPNGVPARAVIQVGAPASGANAAASRPLGLVANSGAGFPTLALIGLAVAAASLFLAGSVSLVASRRRRPAAEAVKAP